MKNEINRALAAKKKENEDQNILKILTLGFYHIEKHRKN